MGGVGARCWSSPKAGGHRRVNGAKERVFVVVLRASLSEGKVWEKDHGVGGPKQSHPSAEC